MALRLVTRRCKLRNEPLALLPCVLRNSTLRALYIVILQIPTHDCFREVGIFFLGGAQCDARYSASGLFRRVRACVGLTIILIKLKSNNELQRVL